MLDWLTQSIDNPLYKDIVWSLPENKLNAGKYLVIGGSINNFKKVSNSFEAFKKIKLGDVKYIIPDSLKSYFQKNDNIEFSVSNRSGSFSLLALDDLLDYSKWKDFVIIIGDLSKNSETQILFEKFINKLSSNLILTSDTLDSIPNLKLSLINRQNLIIISRIEIIQKLIANNKELVQHMFKLNDDFTIIANHLQSISSKISNPLITLIQDKILVLYRGNVSVTKLNSKINDWETHLSPIIAVYYLNTPSKVFESISSAIFSFIEYY